MVVYGKYGMQRKDDRNIEVGVIDHKNHELKQGTLTYHGTIPCALRAIRERVFQDKAFHGTATKDITLDEFMRKLIKSCSEFDEFLEKLEKTPD